MKKESLYLSSNMPYLKRKRRIEKFRKLSIPIMVFLSWMVWNQIKNPSVSTMEGRSLTSSKLNEISGDKIIKIIDTIKSDEYKKDYERVLVLGKDGKEYVATENRSNTLENLKNNESSFVIEEYLNNNDTVRIIREFPKGSIKGISEDLFRTK